MMIDFDYSYLPDLVLILISGSACLYCGMLNRRLRKLQNLKTGVGASIVSLTEAINQTNKAAKEAQSSTLQTVETLRHLLAKAESATPKIDALMVQLVRSAENAKDERQLLDIHIDEKLTPTLEKAHVTAAGLLKAVGDIDNYVDRVMSDSGMRQEEASASLSQIRPKMSEQLSIVS